MNGIHEVTGSIPVWSTKPSFSALSVTPTAPTKRSSGTLPTSRTQRSRALHEGPLSEQRREPANGEVAAPRGAKGFDYYSLKDRAVPLLLPSQSMSPYSAVSAIATTSSTCHAITSPSLSTSRRRSNFARRDRRAAATL